MITVASLASEIFSELGSPTITSTSAIENWLTNNIGLLNSAFGVDIVISGGNFTPELSEPLRVGFKLLYEIYYLGFSSKLALVNASSAVLEVTSDGATTRLVNRVELIKTYKDLIKDLNNSLRDLVNYYRNDNHSIKDVEFADGNYETTASRISSLVREIQ